jgi:hypothetical protein
MAENPHDLEKQVRGLSLNDLTGKAEGGIVDKIVQLKNDYSTGDSQIQHAIEKSIKQYNKSLAGFLDIEDVITPAGTFFTDSTDAGFLPSSITGFFDNVQNAALFDFLSAENKAYIWSFRKVNPDYTGYACRVRREFDNRVVDVKFDANGRVSNSSETVLVDKGFTDSFSVGGNSYDAINMDTFIGYNAPNLEGENPTLKDFVEISHTFYKAGGVNNKTRVVKWYDQGGRVDLNANAFEETLSLTFTNNQHYQYDVGFEGSPNFSLTGYRIITGSNDDPQIYPVYAKAENADRFVLAPHKFGSTSDMRWCLFYSVNTYRLPPDGDETSFSSSVLLAFSNTQLNSQGNSSNRPTSFTSWTQYQFPQNSKSTNTRDTTVTATWAVGSIDRAPIIGEANSLHVSSKPSINQTNRDLFLDTNGRVYMDFKSDGNVSRLSSASAVDTRNGTWALTCAVNDAVSAGSSDKVAVRFGINSSVSVSASDAYIGHGILSDINSPVGGGGSAGKFYAKNASTGDSSVKLIESTEGDIASIIINSNSTALYSDRDETAKVETSDFGTLGGNNTLFVGANYNLTNGWDGPIYEFIAFDDDPKDQASELVRYTGDISSQHNIDDQSIQFYWQRTSSKNFKARVKTDASDSPSYVSTNSFARTLPASTTSVILEINETEIGGTEFDEFRNIRGASSTSISDGGTSNIRRRDMIQFNDKAIYFFSMSTD